MILSPGFGCRVVEWGIDPIQGRRFCCHLSIIDISMSPL
ncbi:hypothetical protein IWQ55_006054 [Labrenzia sp. EL_208]|nr:hypothetical protein [Labrenzia sp. EL_208]